MTDTSEQLTAAEAAARLGVKRQTLYAYVSRGLLSRTVAMDGRTSLFTAAEVDQLRQQRRRAAVGEIPSIISSAITHLDEDGHRYRGEPAIALAAADTDFESVCDLLWQSEGGWEATDADSAAVRRAQSGLPGHTRPIDRLRVTVAVLSATDPLRNDLSPEAMAAAGRRMVSNMVGGLPNMHLGRRRRLADQLWMSLVEGPGSDEQRAALNSALVLLADHGLATSTFAVRVAASVRADPYSVISAGLGAFGGTLHGAASIGVHRLLDRAEESGPDVAVGEELAANRRIPGLGHAVYRDVDPRADVLLDELREGFADDERLELALQLEQILTSRIEHPINIDFALGTLTWLAGMDPDAAAIFAVARTAGWLAHAIEELTEDPVRFRPVARYVGPT